MNGAFLVHLAVGLLPVLAFLAVLVWMESHKIVGVRTVLLVLAAGAAAAVACYVLNGIAIERLDIPFAAYARSVGPVVEEILKALVVVALVRMNRIGFLVDAAILGFAVGAGFAVVENVQYQSLVPDAGLGTWIVRGFGTAIMHGGATAIFATSGVALIERWRRAGPIAYVPGLAIAIALHALYNQGLLPPAPSTLAVLVTVPALLYTVFVRSEAAVGEWLGRGFDADEETIELLDSGRLSDSPIGRYLQSMRARFDGPVVADLLCYLRLHTELSLRAKGLMLMRENGFDLPLDDETRAKFEELRYLERSVGRAGLLAIRPLMHLTPRDLWQMNVLRA